MSSKYSATLLPMNEIFLDNTFNCRGAIDAMSCLDLAKDIQRNGLDTPIAIRLYDKKPPYKYQILAGHRRYTAFKINHANEIPCVLRTDLEDDFSAAAYNLRENIQRQDLNIVQEAKRIEYLLKGGHSQKQVWEMVGKTQGWFEPRKKLMELPPEVHDEAEKGIINQSHIATLHRYRNDKEKLFSLIREIKQRHENGEKVIEVKSDATLDDITKNRKPKPVEMKEMRDLIAKLLTNKLEGHYFPHQLLSWVLGDVPRIEIYKGIKKECEKLELDYSLPPDVQKLLEAL